MILPGTILPEIPKSFVTTIRVNLIEIAKIAMFLEDHDYQINNKSRSKLAATGIHLIAAHLSRYNIETTEEAIVVLRKLGYGESLAKERRDFKPLLKQMSKENIYLDTVEARSSAPVNQDDIKTNTLRLVQEYNESHSPETPAIDKTALKSVIAPVEDEVESPQLKIRTSEDERADISKIRTAMSVPDGAPIEVLEENKPDQS